jgi:hypothetical protein
VIDEERTTEPEVGSTSLSDEGPTGIQPDATPGDPLKRTRGEAIGVAVGSFMGGIEQMVFQRRPPAIELVRQAQPVRATTGDGRELTIELPGDRGGAAPSPEHATTEPPAAAHPTGQPRSPD